ncbi:MAG: hypothetical protein QOH70_670 [Blastocatellia bacterium]|jgi:hypothetical protein|nr:hypothetical protein [Blastocatellia bacterium]
MVTKTNIFNLAKSLVGKFVLPAILKSTAYGFLGGVLFFLVSLVVYNFGPGLLLVNQHIALRMIVAILLLALYTGLGIVAGLVLGGTSSIRRKLPAAQEGIHTMLAPVTSRIIERIPVGQEGIALEKFTLLVDTGINSVASESQQRSRLLSFASFGARILVQRLLRICRALFVVNFIRTLQERGETHVNVILLTVNSLRRISFITSCTSLSLANHSTDCTASYSNSVRRPKPFYSLIEKWMLWRLCEG